MNTFTVQKMHEATESIRKLRKLTEYSLGAKNAKEMLLEINTLKPLLECYLEFADALQFKPGQPIFIKSKKRYALVKRLIIDKNDSLDLNEPISTSKVQIVNSDGTTSTVDYTDLAPISEATKVLYGEK